MADSGSKRGRALISVPHVQQQYNWDCGLACSQMVLRFLQVNLSDFHIVCAQLNFGTSVWTVDLAHIMAHYRVSHLFVTLTLGVDTGYGKKSFYKSSFSTDEKRVNGLFESPESLGISLSKRSVSIDDVKQHLDGGNVVIFLIDWNHLDCRRCHRRIFPCIPKCMSSYQGHFIVVVGYDDEQNTIFYKNPSYKEEICCCSIKTFNSARKSYGTDEDALFIYKDEVTEAAATASPQNHSLS